MDDMIARADPSATDWEPFGRPLFEDPAARELSRVGVVDVGSNSVRLVVFDGAARSPAYFFNEKIMCALGQGLSETGRLNPEGRARALAAIDRFQHLARGIDLPPLTAVATAAVRDAEDGEEFCAEVERETGLRIHVIDGAEEARLSAQGVLLGWPGATGLVCDIGGSSMELAVIRDGAVDHCVTSALGPLKLQGMKYGKRTAYIDRTIAQLVEQVGCHDRLFLVGGSWRAIARIDMARRGYPLHVLHEYRMSPEDIASTARFIATTDADKLKTKSGVSSNRLGLVPLAAEVLTRLVEAAAPREIAISSYGIREGLLYEQMPERVRARDPLIEACRFAEAKDARLPGFGKQLYRFVLPLFEGAPYEKLRLVKAACLLHDVSWRAHPDYRAEVCFDNATRANLGGLDHAERVFLGLALLHRYRNKREGSRFEPLFALLDEERIREAQILGKAMRFGAMLWLQKDAQMAGLALSQDRGTLELTLPEGARALYGEVAEARFRSLAASLGAEIKVTLV